MFQVCLENKFVFASATVRNPSNNIKLSFVKVDLVTHSTCLSFSPGLCLNAGDSEIVGEFNENKVAESPHYYVYVVLIVYLYHSVCSKL